MKTIGMLALALLAAAMILGCAEEPVTTDTVEVTTAEEAARTYQVNGVIVSKDPAASTVTLDHEAIGDWMGAMTMKFPVRGDDVQALPAEGTRVTGTVHVEGTDFWVTGIEPAEDDAPLVEDPETVESEEI
jgi:Cu/Ag efflux protein CusF